MTAKSYKPHNSNSLQTPAYTPTSNPSPLFPVTQAPIFPYLNAKPVTLPSRILMDGGTSVVGCREIKKKPVEVEQDGFLPGLVLVVLTTLALV